MKNINRPELEGKTNRFWRNISKRMLANEELTNNILVGFQTGGVEFAGYDMRPALFTNQQIKRVDISNSLNNLRPMAAEKNITLLQPYSIQSAADDKILLLYIEDDPASQELVRSIFRRHSNISLLCAFEAQIGIELALAHNPDLILLDINLPDMNGFEALNRLKTCDKTKNIPVIGLSAETVPSDVPQETVDYFAGYIQKPFDINELLEAIDSSLLQAGKT